ncbi:hypothetical protein [Variovorax sp. JS1663]|uniref:hypothetical protein n=1 Tax=Variovorax sp. JS1663 TaxID=1851577 RepID=UPI000B343956|nr:hypothetical protein [Variovorax sp. JS1663]OUM01756.1 hypothetical protein A8M77_14435 [Variovorax sp. JS1663]
MSEPERLCRTCTHSRTKDGAQYTNEDMAYCARAQGESSNLINCPSQRFAVADEPAGVCGAEGIFWEARA